MSNVKDPVVTELERLAPLLNILCSFMYADLYEANFGLDHLDKKAQFPVLVFIITGTGKNNIL